MEVDVFGVDHVAALGQTRDGRDVADEDGQAVGVVARLDDEVLAHLGVEVVGVADGVEVSLDDADRRLQLVVDIVGELALLQRLLLDGLQGHLVLVVKTFFSLGALVVDGDDLVGYLAYLVVLEARSGDKVGVGRRTLGIPAQQAQTLGKIAARVVYRHRHQQRHAEDDRPDGGASALERLFHVVVHRHGRDDVVRAVRGFGATEDEGLPAQAGHSRVTLDDAPDYLGLLGFVEHDGRAHRLYDVPVLVVDCHADVAQVGRVAVVLVHKEEEVGGQLLAALLQLIDDAAVHHLELGVDVAAPYLRLAVRLPHRQRGNKNPQAHQHGHEDFPPIAQIVSFARHVSPCAIRNRSPGG